MQLVVVVECNNCERKPRYAARAVWYFFLRLANYNNFSASAIAAQIAMKVCRACGVDVSKDTKNRHPLSGKDICPTLTDFATNAVRSLPSPSGCEVCLDVRKFEAGYVCQRCYRQLTTLHTLQKKLRDTKDAITNKVAKIASLLPSKQLQASNSMMPTPETENETQPSTNKSPPRSSRKRAASDVPSNADRIKRRRILEAVESVPTSSSKSPDVAVSLSE